MTMANEVKITVTAVDHASQALGKTTGVINKMAVGAGVAAAAIGTVLVKALDDSIREARESVRVTNQTMAVLKSTGQAANITARGVEKLATAISNKTGIDDEAIQSGENLLLTFTNIRNETGKGNQIFNQATKVITDMSVALGQDMKSSAIQVGKALNDPIKGLTALRRVGVSFTEDQEKQIKKLVKHGKTLEAQKIILHELKKEFGGSAEAAATWGDKLRTAVGNAEESFGKKILPAVDTVSKYLVKKAIPAVEDFIDSFDAEKINDTADSIIIIGDAIGTVAGAMRKWDKANGRAFTTFGINIGLVDEAFTYWKAKILDGLATVLEAWAKLNPQMKKPAKDLRAMSNAAQEELDKVTKEAAKAAYKIRMEKFNAKIKADKHDLDAKYKDSKAKLEWLKKQKPTPQVRADIRQARAQLREVRWQLDRLHDKTIQVRVQSTLAGRGIAATKATGGPVSHAAEGGPRANQVLVGERGPEIVQLPGGSHVFPNGNTAGMTGRGGGNTYITVNAPNYVGSVSELIRALVDAKRRGQLDVVLR